MKYIRRRRRDRVAETLASHDRAEERLRQASETLVAYRGTMFPGTTGYRFDGFDYCSPIPCDYEDNFLCFRHRVTRDA